MRDNQLKDAKATLSAMVGEVARGEAFAITRHGRRDAVVMSGSMWERLSNVPSFGCLLAASPIEDGDLSERDRAPHPSAEL